MKKKKKTIIEENKASMSKKIGKYAVIVVLYIALVSTLAFIIGTINLIVNADSINDTPDYQYMKTSHYNWDNITWNTTDLSIVTGSNDTSSTLESFNDYFAIGDINIQMVYKFNSILTFPTFWDGSSSLRLISTIPIGAIYNDITPTATVWTNLGGFRFSSGTSYQNLDFMGNSFASISGVTYYFSTNTWNNDFIPTIYFYDFEYFRTNNIDMYNWLLENGQFISTSNGNVIKRTNIYNSGLSSIDTLVYDSTLVTDLKFTSIVFEKNNFFLKVGDLNKIGSPQILASVLNGGYDILYDIVGWVKKNGDTEDITLQVDKREDVLGYQYLFPSKFELFGNESVSDDDMMYIEELRVLVEFPNNYVNNLSYRYGVDSIEYNNIKYGGVLTNWVNSSIGINMGEILLNNVNSFLQFEILPNFTLYHLFILIVAIPLLIWILKLILGG